MPTAGLETPEPAGFVPGHPEADELGVLDRCAGHLLADEGRIVLDGGDGGLPGGLGPDVVRHRIPEGSQAAVGDAPSFGALAGVGSEVGGVGHMGSQVCD